MLLNYLKFAWKVLLRRPFFTAISLFGVSFTLMVLLVVLSMLDDAGGNHAPELRADRLLYVSSVVQKYKGNGWSNSPVSLDFCRRYVRTLKMPEMVALTSSTNSMTGFADGRSLTLDVAYTDGNFWRVHDFNFLSGRPFSNAEADEGAHVCVVNAHTALAFFGTTTGVAGREIEVGALHYRVAGVVPDVPTVHLYTSADVWVPYHLNAESYGKSSLFGPYMAIILARRSGDIPAIQAEFQATIRRIPVPEPQYTLGIYSFAESALAGIVRSLLGRQDGSADSSGLTLFWVLLSVAGLLFMLLPALNLMNLNITRILERSGEIGVRKAFGASGRALVGQFVVENLVLAALGGVLGLGLAAGALAIINESHVFPYANFGLDWRAFFWALGLAVVFGLLSGVYPAWKMSRLPPVEALRQTGGGPQ